jgi:2-dehydro-3-deoxyphosphogluconate aldolase / (4S)-4-hydroxy-2-oxoglutarate aldolase
MNTLDWIQRSKIVPVIRATSAELAFEVVTALVEGGIDVLEITMRVPGAIEVMRQIDIRYGNHVLLGAGTVIDPETAGKCIDAGAKFIVSPCLDLPTVQACVQRDIPIAPGAFTPTEVLTAWRAGASIVKVFPCEAAGGPGYIRSLRAPFPLIPLMPTGGVALSNAAAYLAAGAVAVGVGSDLVDLNLIRDGKRDELVARARAFRVAVSG